MLITAVLLAFIVVSLVYVYRFRGDARYASLGEFFRKGWPIFTPLNCLLYLTTTRRGAGAILDPADYPELESLRDNWQVIRHEGMALHQQGEFDASKRPGTAGYYDVGFRTFFKYGWSRFYLKWYGYTHSSAQRLCPRTIEILHQVPGVRGAMFALLPAGAQLTRHADPLALSLRYHLGLATPNSSRCFINVDGTPRHWRDGEVLMFDETYLHYARNDTEVDRLILMCDIARPTNWAGSAFAFLYGGLARLTVVPNTPEDRRGLANWLFASLAPTLARARSLKSTHRSVYLLLKYSVNTLLLLSVLGLLIGLMQLVGGMISVGMETRE